MRKVNFAEVSAEFDELSKSLARDGNHQYAAFCAMAVARCEQVMQNAANEASATSEAARLFWEAEQESQSYRFSVDGSNYGYEEYFLEAVDCYELAIEVREIQMANSFTHHCYTAIPQARQYCNGGPTPN